MAYAWVLTGMWIVKLCNETLDQGVKVRSRWYAERLRPLISPRFEAPFFRSICRKGRDSFTVKSSFPPGWSTSEETGAPEDHPIDPFMPYPTPTKCSGTEPLRELWNVRKPVTGSMVTLVGGESSSIMGDVKFNVIAIVELNGPPVKVGTGAGGTEMLDEIDRVSVKLDD